MKWGPHADPNSCPKFNQFCDGRNHRSKTRWIYPGV